MSKGEKYFREQKEEAQKKHREKKRQVREKEYPGLYPKTHRKGIKKEIKDEVWNRDNGECVECGLKKDLEFDHIIPYSKGGADSVNNLQILCRPCNRKKSNKIG